MATSGKSLRRHALDALLHECMEIDGDSDAPLESATSAVSPPQRSNDYSEHQVSPTLLDIASIVGNIRSGMCPFLICKAYVNVVSSGLSIVLISEGDRLRPTLDANIFRLVINAAVANSKWSDCKTSSAVLSKALRMTSLPGHVSENEHRRLFHLMSQWTEGFDWTHIIELEEAANTNAILYRCGISSLVKDVQSDVSIIFTRSLPRKKVESYRCVWDLEQENFYHYLGDDLYRHYLLTLLLESFPPLSKLTEPQSDDANEYSQTSTTIDPLPRRTLPDETPTKADPCV